MTPLQAQTGADAFDWAVEFRPFTLFHLVTSGLAGACIIGSCWLGARWWGTPHERRLRLAWIWGVFCVQVFALTYFLRPPIAWEVALPFHICDLAGWVAFFALVTQRRWLRSILFYWGIVLSTQAFITPILRGPGSGYATPYYWAFWLQHLTIVGSAIYDCVVLRFRPRWRDCGVAIGITAFWTITMFIYNRIFHTNYVFVGPTRPDNPTIIDRLGNYPLRVLWLALIVIAGFLGFTAVARAWRAIAHRTLLRSRHARAAAPPRTTPPSA